MGEEIFFRNLIRHIFSLSLFIISSPFAGTKKSSDEKEEYFTTGGDSLNSQKSHSGAENKFKDVQNKDSEAKNKNGSDELESARQTNKLRLRHLKRACDEVESLLSQPRSLASLQGSLAQYKSFLPTLPPKEQLLKVDPNLGLAVCVPYKAGSETWRYLLGGQTPSDLQQVGDAHKAIQVREPYERLLSAYRFVFEDPGGLRNTDHLASALREAFPHLPLAKTKRGEPTASFSQFIASIVDGPAVLPAEQQKLLIEGAALHWLPFHGQCPPCSDQFEPQSILKLETWLGDTRLLLHSTKLSNPCLFNVTTAK